MVKYPALLTQAQENGRMVYIIKYPDFDGFEAKVFEFGDVLNVATVALNERIDQMIEEGVGIPYSSEVSEFEGICFGVDAPRGESLPF